MKPEICMLARSWEEYIDPTGWLMSEKLEGERMIRPRGNIDIFSRKGNPFRPPQWWRDQLPRGPFLDGEGWIGRGKFELTQSILGKRNATDDEWRQVKFMCIEPCQLPSTPLRFIPEQAVFRPIIQTICAGREHLASFYQSIVSAGGEGVVLRHPNQPYHVGRSPYLLKVKPEIKGTATVTGYNREGLAKQYGGTSERLISLEVRWQQPIPLREIAKADQEHRSPLQPPPVEFNIANGLTEAMRSNPPPISSEIPFVYQCLSANGVPMFAKLAKKGSR